MPIYSRTPVATAQSFATLDEFSHGRAVIGLGVSHRPVVEAWYGQTIDKPLRDTRVCRDRARDPARRGPGRRAKSSAGFRFLGYESTCRHPDLSRGPVRRCCAFGEIADGVVLWLCNPHYIRDVVVPAVSEGREKAGPPLEGFDIVAAVPSAITSEPEEARRGCVRSSSPTSRSRSIAR